MQIDRSLVSLAILKVNWDQKNFDYIENFVPFIATLIKLKKYSEIKPDEIVKDFSEEYGLIIPYEAIISILTRCKKRGLVKREGHLHFPVWENIYKYDFSTESNNQETRFNKIISELQKEIKTTIGKEIDKEEISSALISFLKENDIELLFAANDLSLLPEVKESKSLRYQIFRFITNCFTKEPELATYIKDISIGHVLANTILYKNDLNKFRGSLKRLTIYLDIKFLLRISGIELLQRKENVIQFLDSLKDRGAQIKVFVHTYEETLAILNGAKKWLDNNRYDPIKASQAIKYFVENSQSETDVDLCIARLRSYLFQNEIEIEEAPDPVENSKYLIEETKLNDEIVSVYTKMNENFNEVEKEQTIQKDIKSISSIYLLRKKYKPMYLKDSRFLFVTANTSLAYAAKEFEKKQNDTFSIPACMTHILLGTTIWLDNPQMLSNFNEKKVIADCYAAAQPTDKLIKKYLIEIDKLKLSGKINDDEYYFLKTNKAAYNALEEATYGDEDNFDEKTHDEIMHILRREGRKESQEEIEKLKNANLDKEEEIRKITENYNALKGNVDRLSSRISIILAWLVVIVVVAIALISYLIDIFDWPNYVDLIISILIFVLSFILGVNIKIIYRKIKRSVYSRILGYFLEKK